MKKHNIFLLLIFLNLFIFVHSFCLDCIENHENSKYLIEIKKTTPFYQVNFLSKSSHFSFFAEKSRENESHLQKNKEHFQPLIIGWKVPSSLFSYTQQWLFRPLKPLANIFFSWQIQSNKCSSYKIIFLVYKSYLANKIQDFDISILSSRAHPPTT